MSMNIYAKPGTKVRYTGTGGYDAQRQLATKHIEVGQILTVKETNIDKFMTYVEFEEIPNMRFNSVMFVEVEDPKKTFWEHNEEFSNETEKAFEFYANECDEYWNNLSYDEKLKAFHSVCKRIHKGDVADGRSYRGVLYDVFGFGSEAYVIGMNCGYMDLHNYIQEGVSALKQIFKKK